jgi:hypothetical protein
MQMIIIIIRLSFIVIELNMKKRSTPRVSLIEPYRQHTHFSSSKEDPMLKKTTLTAAMLTIICMSGTAESETATTEADALDTAVPETEAEKIERLEREIEALKDAYIEGAPRRVKRIANRDKEESKWSDRINVGALIEVEASYVSPFEGSSESDIVVATFAPYITSKVNDWIGVEASLLYEQDETDLEVDIATVSIANSDKTPFYSIIGQTYMPFGNYDTNMVSDPLTLEIGESRETAIQVGTATFGFTGVAYMFNGDLDGDSDNSINDWGGFLGYNKEFDFGGLGLGLGYISSLGESDSLQDGIHVSDDVSGTALNARLDIGNFNIIGEYVGANDSFDTADIAYRGSGAKPSAYNIEAGYSFSTLGKDSVIAAGYQGSKESVALELPESRFLVTYAVKVLRNTGVLIEYAYDSDYDVSDGGSGENGSSLTAQLAVVF